MEINDNYLQQQGQRRQINDNDNDDDINNNNLEWQLQELFVDEPSILLKDEQQKFTCSLTWWKAKQTKYKLLSEVALYVLCIPATSALSERVFSVARLTIAKDWARLAPQTANELIFLHDVIPALNRYEECCT